MNHPDRLRAAIEADGTTPLIGVFDMFSASLAARHYDGMFVSGFGFAASHYGLPDIGFIAWPDIVGFVQRLRLAFPLPLEEYLAKLDLVLQARRDLVVVARTDATEEEEILRRAKALAATDADVILVDGVRSVDWIHKVRRVIDDKPLLFNQIAGGKSPRLSLGELHQLGVDVAIYSTPCLFAAQTAIDRALDDLKRADGRLPEHTPDAVGVAECLALLEQNISRHHDPLPVDAAR